jgi:hypothetical protein
VKHPLFVTVALGLFLIASPTTIQAHDPEPEKQKSSAWSIALRFGGFSDNAERDWWTPSTRYYGYDPTPQVTGGLEVSRFFGRKNGLTLSLDAMTFASGAVVMTPVTLTYRFFPVGNGLLTKPGKRPPAVQPWIGIGGGAFPVVLDDTDVVRTDPGAQAAAGLFVPLGRHFDVLGELRYAATSDSRMLLYTMGLGVRF